MIPSWVAILALFAGATIGCITAAIFAAHRRCGECELAYKYIAEEDKP